MRFHRTIQPAAPDRAEVKDVVTRFIAEDVAFVTRTADPFLIDHGCCNPLGHEFIASCGAIVCVHCAKVAWQ